MELESYVLLNTNDREIVGSFFLTNEHVLVTVQSQGVYMYNIHDRKCVNSWLFGPSSYFTHHAVQHPFSRDLLAVQDGRYLIRWEELNTELKKVKRKTFKEGDIFSILVHPQLKQDYIVVFLSGAVAIGDRSMALKHIIHLESEKKEIVCCVAVKIVDRYILLFLATTVASVKGQYILHVVRYALNSQTLQFSAEHPLEARNGKTITTMAFDTDSLYLTALWEDGWLEFYSLKNLYESFSLVRSRSYSLNIFGSPTSCASSFTGTCNQPNDCSDGKVTPNTRVPAAPSSEASDNNIKSGILKEGLTVFVGPAVARTDGDEDSSSRNSFCVMVWDQNFGTVHAFVELNNHLDISPVHSKRISFEDGSGVCKAIQKSGLQSESRVDGKLSNVTQVLVDQGSDILLIGLSHHIVICQIFTTTSSLAQSLGKYDLTQSFIRQNDEDEKNILLYDFASNIDYSYENTKAKFVLVGREGFNRACGEALCEASQVLDKLVNRTKTPDLQSFMYVFEGYVAKTDQLMQANLSKSLPIVFPSFDKFLNLASFAEEAAIYIEDLGYFELGKHATLQEIYYLKATKERNQNQLDQLRHMKLNFSEFFLSKVTQRCLNEDFLYAPLKQLIESKRLTCRLVPNLLKKIMASRQFDLLFAALANIPDISELDLISIIKWLFREVEPTSLQAFFNEYKNQSESLHLSTTTDILSLSTKESKTTVSRQEFDNAADSEDHQGFDQTPIQIFLNAIIKVPINVILMQSYIRTLDLKEAMEILKYASSCLEHRLSASILSRTGPDRENMYFSVPSLASITTWVSMLIDARFSEFILVSDCARILKSINSALSKTIELLDNMQKLRNSLVYYFDLDLVTRDKAAEYSIEIFPLK